MALSPKAKKMLEDFRDTANVADLQHYDWTRFHHFVIQAHKDDGPEPRDSDVSSVLGEKWTADAAAQLGGTYVEERRLLKLYDQPRAR
jgi:hypothetical protein